MNNRSNRRSLIVPEVVQTSAMDCGPASLKCVLEGFGVSVSYGRLREACQTDVDGTSIDTMEEVARQLGLDAEQVLVPEDHLLLDDGQALPGIVVTRQPNGLTHFLVVWRRFGRFVQVMDPGAGRRWLACAELKKELYIHTAQIPAEMWRAWAGTDAFLNPLRARLRKLVISDATTDQHLALALADAGWRSLAMLDAAARMIDAIVRGGGLRPGRQTANLLSKLMESSGFASGRDQSQEAPSIPPHYWSARLAPQGFEGDEMLYVRGAVLVHVRGRLSTSEIAFQERATVEAQALSPELAAALAEKPHHPGRELLRMLAKDGRLSPTVLIAALALAAAGVMIEALLFQGLFDLGRKLGTMEQRLGAMAALLVFSGTLLCLEWPLAASTLRIGRRLEARLRLTFLKKIPRLGDRYFQSRLISDMAERSHSVTALRRLPELAGRLLRAVFELALTIAGLAWLDPAGATVATAVGALSLVLPLLSQSRLTERDLRIRSHNGALGGFYLDAMLGLIAVRAHAAETAVRREHESLLVEWARASFGLLRAVVAVEAVQSIAAFGLAAWLLFDHLSRGEAGGVLLLVYWALNLPALGREIALAAQQYPAARNVTLRLLEPLGAPEEGGEREIESVNVLSSIAAPETQSSHWSRRTPGAEITFESVSVRAAGHAILDDVDLLIEPGSHVAIVGASGAGKSTLVGLLLGWHRAASGRVLVDGEALEGAHLARLRETTAWVDPAVQLWNRSLIENLQYGAADSSRRPLNRVLEAADLRSVLERLPEGFQTALGEGGGLVSGGEGQRVRFGRALLRSDVRLVILDEPFRGLARERRRALLKQARTLWQDATLLCITHDVSETLEFERVLVVDGGRIAEDGAPSRLSRQAGSRYRSLLEAEEAVRTELWGHEQWRRIVVDNGKVVEDTSQQAAATLALGGRQLHARTDDACLAS